MFMNYRERFEYLKLSEGFDFVGYANHKIELRCKECGYAWWKYDDFIRKSMHGKVVCVNCGLTCKYEAPNYEKRVPKPPYVKKGYHTQAVIEAREKRTAIQRQQGEELYRQKFEALGLDFTFLKREWSRPHDNRFWIRCNKCGTEFLRDRAILNGVLKSVHCKNCGNGTILHSAFVDEVMDFYSDKHSVKETAETFGISERKVNEWVKRRGVTNGRTIGEINSEKGKIGAAVRAKQMKAEAERRLIYKLNDLGFDYLGGYDGKKSHVITQCQKCGEVVDRAVAGILKDGAICRNCRRIEADKLARKKAEDKRLQELKRREKQKQKENRFDEVFVCKECKKNYTPRDYMKSKGLRIFSNPGFCCVGCQNRFLRRKSRNKQKANGTYKKDTHRARCKRFGCPYDPSVTLKKAIERYGLFCAICGLICIPEDRGWTKYFGPMSPTLDHIIPLAQKGSPGHVWGNVQIAHAMCNSCKSDKMRREDGKYETNKKSRRAKVNK